MDDDRQKQAQCSHHSHDPIRTRIETLIIKREKAGGQGPGNQNGDKNPAEIDPHLEAHEFE